MISLQSNHYNNETWLSSSIWEIKKETGQLVTLTWSIVRTVPAYSNILKKCAYCLHVKLETPKYHKPEELLDKRSEIMFRCSHQRQLLSNYDSKDWVIA